MTRDCCTSEATAVRRVLGYTVALLDGMFRSATNILTSSCLVSRNAARYGLQLTVATTGPYLANVQVIADQRSDNLAYNLESVWR